MKKIKFFFFIEMEEDAAQITAHVLSGIAIAYVADLFFDWNPVKTFVKSILPAKATKTTTTK